MTNRLVQDGQVLMVTTGATARTNGQLIKEGDTFGVVLKTTATGMIMPLAIEGVYTLPKIAGASTNLLVGQLVYARATGSTYKVLGVATGNAMGTAFAIAATGATSAVVKLHGFATN
jgi:predicted RecA/RadA family phage recombinase